MTLRRVSETKFRKLVQVNNSKLYRNYVTQLVCIRINYGINLRIYFPCSEGIKLNLYAAQVAD